MLMKQYPRRPSVMSAVVAARGRWQQYRRTCSEQAFLHRRSAYDTSEPAASQPITQPRRILLAGETECTSWLPPCICPLLKYTLRGVAVTVPRRFDEPLEVGGDAEAVSKAPVRHVSGGGRAHVRRTSLVHQHTGPDADSSIVGAPRHLRAGVAVSCDSGSHSRGASCSLVRRGVLHGRRRASARS